MGYVLLPSCSHKRVSMYHMAPKISQLPESARNRPGTADTVYACGLVSWATWAESGEEAFLPKTFFILGLAIFSIRNSTGGSCKRVSTYVPSDTKNITTSTWDGRHSLCMWSGVLGHVGRVVGRSIFAQNRVS